MNEKERIRVVYKRKRYNIQKIGWVSRKVKKTKKECGVGGIQGK